MSDYFKERNGKIKPYLVKITYYSKYLLVVNKSLKPGEFSLEVLLILPFTFLNYISSPYYILDLKI